MISIRVQYSCFVCSTIKAGVDVPARGDEDLKTWMDALLVILSRDHDQRSPTCPTDGSLHDVMIPISGAVKVGGPPVQ